jgi:hypothetical protein
VQLNMSRVNVKLSRDLRLTSISKHLVADVRPEHISTPGVFRILPPIFPLTSVQLNHGGAHVLLRVSISSRCPS